MVRCNTFDLHPSGPLHGSGESPAQGMARELESGILALEPELAALLEREGLRAERRATRLVVRQLRWHLEDDTLELQFELSRGSFATTVLARLLVELDEDAPAVE